MTNLEIMLHAKSYVDKLAQGINPLTGQVVPEGDVINNVRIARCFFYVSTVLQRVIDNDGVVDAVKDKAELQPFALPFEERSRYTLSEQPLIANQIARKFNMLVDLNTMQKLKNTSIIKFLVQSGMLQEEIGPSGRKNSRPTEAGRSLGITTELRERSNEKYTVVVYSSEAQQFILDNLDAIIAINAAPSRENQGKPWTPEDDEHLRQAVQSGVDIHDICTEFKRSLGAIDSRLKTLGLATS